MRIIKGQRRDAIFAKKNTANVSTRDVGYLRRYDSYLSNSIKCDELSIEDQILLALRNGWSLKGEIIPPVGDDIFFFQMLVKYAEPDSSQSTL